MVSEPFRIIELNMNGFFFKGRGVEVQALDKQQGWGVLGARKRVHDSLP